MAYINISEVKLNKSGQAYVSRIVRGGNNKGKEYVIFGEVKSCKNCGKQYFVKDSFLKHGMGEFCSHKCVVGKFASGYKGGRRIDPNGYVFILSPNHPYANSGNTVAEHRLVMEKHIGRYLHRWEMVHHIDGNPLNNDINNLHLTTLSEHRGIHNRIMGPNRGSFQKGHIAFNKKVKI